MVTQLRLLTKHNLSDEKTKQTRENTSKHSLLIQIVTYIKTNRWHVPKLHFRFAITFFIIAIVTVFTQLDTDIIFLHLRVFVNDLLHFLVTFL